MKRLAFLASVLGLAKLAKGQNNRISVERQVRGTPGSLLAFSSSGDAVTVKPDASIVIDTVAGTIRAPSSVLRRQVVETQVITTAGQIIIPSAPVAQGTTLMVFLNQGLMVEGINYSRSVNGVAFDRQPPLVPGDSVTLSFWT